MNCSPTVTTDNLVSFFWFCKCRWQDHHLSFSRFWSSYRKALTESACETRYQNSWSGPVFLEGEVAYWAQLIFSDPGFPHVVLLLTVVLEGAEGMPGNLFTLPLQTALCTVCGEKSDGVHSNHCSPTASVVICFLLRGRAKLHSKRHDLLHIHSGENALDLEFGIIVPSNPISWAVAEKKTTAKAYHVNYHNAEHVASS